MLCCTKGTLLDGELIISLPPKFVELKRVEFSVEERDFYSRLECDSRTQFEDAPEDAGVSECGHVFCSQCICDYLSSDDNQCPSTNCKVRLNVSSVFSKATLNSSLSDQPNSGGMGSEVFDAVVFL